MWHRHEGRGKPQLWVGVIVMLATLLFASAIPGHTWRGGGQRGGGHGFHGGQRGGGHGFHGGHGWRGHGFHGRHSWGGVGVSIGVGSYWGPYWGPYGYPYAYPYAYPYVYPYTYPPQVYVQPSQQLSIQSPSSPPSWYYCADPEGYYPYVQQCPGGWQTVPPSPQ